MDDPDVVLPYDLGTSYDKTVFTHTASLLEPRKVDVESMATKSAFESSAVLPCISNHVVFTDNWMVTAHILYSSIG